MLVLAVAVYTNGLLRLAAQAKAATPFTNSLVQHGSKDSATVNSG
jgi:hypothetical protein